MNRKCGSCTLCCKLLPVRELSKAANQRCQHQSSKGCSVYHQEPEFPPSCGLWSCRWLTGDGTEAMHRPDRVGYVIDIMPDLVKLTANNTGETLDLMVVQVWVDPARRDVWRDPGLLHYAEAVANEHGMGMLIRYSSTEAFTVLAPPLCEDRQWHVSDESKIIKSKMGSMLLDRLTEEIQK